MDEDIKAHVKDSSAWIRLLFMLLSALFYSAAEVVILAVAVFQSACVLVTGKTHERALLLGSQLSAYCYLVFRYLTYNTEERPFPFSDWPTGEPLAEAAGKPAARAKQPKKPARRRTKKAGAGKEPEPEPEGAAGKPGESAEQDT